MRSNLSTPLIIQSRTILYYYTSKLLLPSKSPLFAYKLVSIEQPGRPGCNKLYFICVTYGLPYFSFRFVSLRFFFSFLFLLFRFFSHYFVFVFLRFVFFFVSFRYFSPCFLFVFFFFPFLFVSFRFFRFSVYRYPKFYPELCTCWWDVTSLLVAAAKKGPKA